MKFNIGDTVWGIVWFSELGEYDPLDVEYIHGQITSTKLCADGETYMYTIVDENFVTEDDMKLTEEVHESLIFDTKEHLFDSVFKHEREFLNEMIEKLNKYEEDYNKDKEKFLNGR